MRGALLASLLVLSAASFVARADEPVRLYAAGSLRTALTAATAAFTGRTGIAVTSVFGPSGLLRDRIASGEKGEVFASANMEHPQALVSAGKAEQVRPFARNRLCALASPRIEVTTDSLLARMLDPGVRLGTSTPRADPSGDYAWELFAKAEGLRPGARAALESKALKLTGGPDSPSPPKGRNVYGMLVAEGKAEVFLTYCTNAMEAVEQNPGLNMVPVPEALAVGAEYGLAVLLPSRSEATRLAEFILSPEGQSILARYGFSTVSTR